MIYKTKQKEYLLDYFKKKEGKLFFAKEINEELKSKSIDIGLTTIYRLLDNLVSNNIIMIFYGEFGKKYGYFPCSEHSHYHLICNKCGNITHIDCDEFNHLNNHLIDSHNFYLDSKEIFLKGMCKKCC